MNATNQSEKPEEKPQKIEANRPPFDETLMKSTEEFVDTTLRNVPELAGIAIVPVWLNPVDGLPPAMLRLRNPDEPPMSAMLQLVQNMSKFSLILNKTLLEQYQFFYAQVQKLSQQFKDIEAKTAANRTQE